MSRIGKLPVKIGNNVSITIEGDVITFNSGKLTKIYQVRPGIQISYSDNLLRLSLKEGVNNSAADIGMDRSNIKNIVLGLQEPFKIILEINGVGYKAVIEKNLIILSLGYSHEIAYLLPEGVNAALDKPNLLILSGSDKILVGQVAAEIISFRKPEPYKGKGIKVFNKPIVRKEGKKK